VSVGLQIKTVGFRSLVLGVAAFALAACGGTSDQRTPEVVYHGSDGYYRPGADGAYPDQAQYGGDRGEIADPVDMGQVDFDSPDLWMGSDSANSSANYGGVTYLPGANAGTGGQAGGYYGGDQQIASAAPPPRDGSGYPYDYQYERDQFQGTAPVAPKARLDGKTRVGLLVPLTGPHAGIGQSLFRAAQMAMFAHKADGVVLVPRDTQGRPDIAAAQARSLVGEGVDVILGPLFAEAVSAVAPVAQNAGVSVVAFSNNRDVARPGVFLMGFLPEQQVTRVIRFAGENGLYRFAALFPNDDYGRRVSFAFHDSVTRAGNMVAATEVYDNDAQSMFDPVRRLTRYDERVEAYKKQVAELEAEDTPFAREALERLKGQEAVGDVGFDAVLLPAGGTQLKSLAPLLPYYEVDPKDIKFLGTGLWEQAGIGLEPSLVGGWYAGPQPGQEEKFVTQFESVFSSRPPRLASLGFDAMSLAVALHRSAEGGRGRFAPSSITRPQGFSGMDGIFRFHPNGLNERGLAVIEVRATGMRVIDPAPTRFNLYDAEWQLDTPEARARQRLTPQQGDWQQPAYKSEFGESGFGADGVAN